MLSLDHQNVTLTNFNFKPEKHGKEQAPAFDLSISVDIGSDALNSISPGLCETVFRRPKSGDQLRLANENDAMAYTVLRHPEMEPLVITGKFPGYELSIVRNISEDADNPEWETDVFYADVTVKGITVKGHEGGTATVTFQARARDIDYDELGEIARAVVNKAAVLVLTPPTTPVQQLDTEDEQTGAEEVKRDAA